MAYKHGHYSAGKRSRTYRCWDSMIQRCTNPNYSKWHDYGGHGITVCERWRQFVNFLEDMGECPDGLTIERLNSNGNYELSNCKWATYVDQGNNTCRNLFIDFNGQRLTMSQLARMLGVKYSHFRYLYRDKHYSVQEIINQIESGGPPTHEATGDTREGGEK